MIVMMTLVMISAAGEAGSISLINSRTTSARNKMSCEKKEMIDTRNVDWKGKCAMKKRNTVRRCTAEVLMMISTSVKGGRNNVSKDNIMDKS